MICGYWIGSRKFVGSCYFIAPFIGLMSSFPAPALTPLTALLRPSAKYA